MSRKSPQRGRSQELAAAFVMALVAAHPSVHAAPAPARLPFHGSTVAAISLQRHSFAASRLYASNNQRQPNYLLSLSVRGGARDYGDDDDDDETDAASWLNDEDEEDNNDEEEDNRIQNEKSAPTTMGAASESTATSKAAAKEVESKPTEQDDDDDDDDDNDTTAATETDQPLHPALSNEPVPIHVTTTLGQSILDQSLEITAHRSRSVGFVKASLQKQLPGRPPVATLQLKLGPRILADELLIHELMDEEEDEEDDDDDDDDTKTTAMLTFTLDMIPSIDTKSAILSDDKLDELTPRQLLDAFAANEAAMHQNALLMMQEDAEQQIVKDGDGDEDGESRSSSAMPQESVTQQLKDRAIRLRDDMEQKLLQSDASQAVLAETIPPSHKTLNLQEREVRGQRVRQVGQGGVKTTLKRKIQRNFNVNWSDTIRTICLFLFFGYFGGRSPTSRAILLLGAPSVIFLQARPVKIWLRHVVYFVLMHPPSIVLSLLPAPQQALLSVDVDQAMATLYGEYYHDDVHQHGNRQVLREDAGHELVEEELLPVVGNIDDEEETDSDDGY